MEQIANFLAISTLNMPGDLDNSATTLTLTSISTFPSSYPYRARIDDELFKVTATPGANQLTVVRGDGGTTAASHLDTAPVRVVLTKESLDAIVSIQQGGSETSNRRVLNFTGGATVTDDSGNGRTNIAIPAGGGSTVGYGTTGSRPAASQSGNAFFPTDQQALNVDTGSVWKQFVPIFPITTPPLVSAFTWVNQSGATATDLTGGGILLSCAASGGTADSHRLLVETAPATPWTRTAAMFGLVADLAGSRIQMVARESGSGKFVAYGLNFDGSTHFPKFAVTTYNSPTAGVANIAFFDFLMVGPLLWLRLADDGTNRIYSWSPNGVTWFTIYSETRTTFITADQVGFGINQGRNLPTVLQLVHYA